MQISLPVGRSLVLLSLVTLLSGCLTDALLKTKPYSEEVSSVLVTEDKQHVVFVGEKYHYIFDAPPILMESIQASYAPNLRGLMHDFHVDKNNHVTGPLTLILSVSVPAEQKIAAANVGYRCTTRANGEQYCEDAMQLQGTRYVAGNIPIGNQYRLNRTYHVEVKTEDGPGAKALLTPITAVADGVLVIAAVPLLAVEVGIYSANCSTKAPCK